MNGPHPEDVQEEEHAMVLVDGHARAHEHCLVARTYQINVLCQMLGAKGLLKVLELGLPELKVVVLGILLPHSGITVLQTVDLE